MTPWGIEQSITCNRGLLCCGVVCSHQRGPGVALLLARADVGLHVLRLYIGHACQADSRLQPYVAARFEWPLYRIEIYGCTHALLLFTRYTDACRWCSCKLVRFDRHRVCSVKRPNPAVYMDAAAPAMEPWRIRHGLSVRIQVHAHAN
jgi:hypothetical protein